MERATAVAGPWDERDDDDFRIEWFSGSGAGGQHRNKTQNCCRIRHVPTGAVESRQGRNRVDNLREATAAIMSRLDAMRDDAASGASASSRRAMVGSGQRGDKVRTVRFQADEAVDHRNGRRIRATDYMRGMMDMLWISA